MAETGSNKKRILKNGNRELGLDQEDQSTEGPKIQDIIEGPLAGGAPPPPIWFSAVLGAAFGVAAIVWPKGERLWVTSLSVEDGLFFWTICAGSWQLSAASLFA